MALKVQSKFIKEDIIDEKGNKIGEIKFNPSDSTITRKLSKILSTLSKSINKIDSYGDINLSELSKESSVEDFIKVSDEINKLEDIFKEEYESTNESINDLIEIFGKETIDCFTGGTQDIDSLIPLFNFVMPYVKKDRTDKINKYMISKKDNDVMN